MHIKQKGFTLVELLVVVALMGIMAAIALPNMSNWLAARRVASTADQVSSLIRFARTEAMRRNQPVYLCPVQIKSNGLPDNYCNTDYAGAGWTAWVDTDNDHTYTANTDVALRTVILNASNKKQILSRMNQVDFSGTANTANTPMIQFLPNGTFNRYTVSSGTGSLSNVSGGYIKFTFSDAGADSAAQRQNRASVLIFNGNSVVSCERKSVNSSATTTASSSKNTLCTYTDLQSCNNYGGCS